MSKKTTVYIEEELLKRAKEKGINRSKLMNWALRKRLNNPSAEDIRRDIKRLEEKKAGIDTEIEVWKDRLKILEGLNEHKEELKEIKEVIEETGDEKAVWRRFKDETDLDVSFSVFLDKIKGIKND